MVVAGNTVSVAAAGSGIWVVGIRATAASTRISHGSHRVGIGCGLGELHSGAASKVGIRFFLLPIPIGGLASGCGRRWLGIAAVTVGG